MKGACDCHVHVFGPPERYPFSARRKYTPPQASFDQLLAFQDKLGFERVVIVQASPYGTDNRCLLDALRRLGGRARGIAVIAPRTPRRCFRSCSGATPGSSFPRRTGSAARSTGWRGC